ncbi:MAG: hypothetical protein IJR85_02320 [Synergistaceae bacterium]|nr:hypothetical protein [Synergistaceae bacterium]
MYDKPERFGVRLYGFKSGDVEQINAVLRKFAATTQRVRGLLLELQDEDRETIETIETPLTLKFLLSENTGDFAVHNTIMKKTGSSFSESLKIVVPVDMELPEEVLPYVKFFKV